MPDWDAKYATIDAPFGDAPNEYVRRIATRPDFHAASALCLADGDGRNGAWLAQRGMAVTAIDSSAVATQKAIERDRAAGITADRITADVTQWEPNGRTWQAVFLIYLQSDAEVRIEALHLAARVVAPGGWLVLEVFAKGPAVHGEPGPKDDAVLYDLPEIESATADLQVIEALEGRVLLDEGVRHRGTGNIIRFAARRSR